MRIRLLIVSALVAGAAYALPPPNAVGDDERASKFAITPDIGAHCSPGDVWIESLELPLINQPQMQVAKLPATAPFGYGVDVKGGGCFGTDRVVV